MKKLLIKAGAGVLLLTALAFLFMRSLEDTRTAPYTVERGDLGEWTLVLQPESRENEPLLSLRPKPELAATLFRQIFSRSMESLISPVDPAIPIVLGGEYDRVVADHLSREALRAAAESAGLESAAMTPRCLVHRRASVPGGTRQVYFILFDAPTVSQFRERLGLDPAAVAPTLFVGGAGADFAAWLPQRADAATDCLAPIEVAGS